MGRTPDEFASCGPADAQDSVAAIGRPPCRGAAPRLPGPTREAPPVLARPLKKQTERDHCSSMKTPKAKTGELKIELGRRYRFAASHRLHSERLSEEENRRLYGKCNNPRGHGHNYVVEVHVSGAIDPATGMIANLADLDGFVGREVLEPFDHRSLNEEVPAFREKVPTTENLCIEIFRRLRTFPKAKLERVRVEETSNNSFEFADDDVVNDSEKTSVQ
jgi:6-pyruvoyltetrahydropterin/6-carboxytetrahydropterin synthase